MLKYDTYDITYRELPDEVALTFSISSCPNMCRNCHSPHLRDNIGTNIWESIAIIDKYKDHITAICFLGHGGLNRIDYFRDFLDAISMQFTNLKLGVYSGFDYMIEDFKPYLHYYKVGRYIEELGGLDSSTTNQIIHKLK